MHSTADTPTLKPSPAHAKGCAGKNSRRSCRDLLRLALEFNFKRHRWPRWIEAEPRKVPGERVVGTTLSVTFINHATVLLQVEGMNILTDPVFSERASPFTWAGPKRVRPPGIALEDLPEIDVILISHNHYDHLDADALRKIVAKNGRPLPLILTGRGNGRILRKHGLTCYREMKWGDSSSFGGAEIIFTESRHGSGRSMADQMEALWGAFVIKTGRGRPIYFAGDSGYGDHFRQAGDRYGPFDLSLIPIGAYEPRWFMQEVHLNPREAVQAHLDLKSEHSVAIHFGTFPLTTEGIDEPVIELRKNLRERGVSEEKFQVLDFGETLQIRDPAVSALDS